MKTRDDQLRFMDGPRGTEDAGERDARRSTYPRRAVIQPPNCKSDRAEGTRDSREIDRISAERATPLPVASKTADIEGVLVTGVHGPASVEIVLVR
jgi:L-lactate utilization protein LutC